MPDYTQNPTYQDIEVLLKSSAYWPEGTPESAKVLYAQEQATLGINAAIDEFEERTGWFPFLSPSDSPDETRTFEFYDQPLPGGVLVFNAGLLSLTSCTYNDEAMTLGQGAMLRPSNALSRKRPYTNLFFPYLLYGRMGHQRHVRITVTGRWGYCCPMKRDAFEEIVQYGAVKALSQVENTQSIASISQDGFSKSYDIVGILTQKDLAGPQGVWSKGFDACVARYRRMI